MLPSLLPPDILDTIWLSDLIPLTSEAWANLLLG